MDIHWTITVNVPQLEALQHTILELGEKLVETVESIVAALDRVVAAQVAGSNAIAEQITAIAEEIAQWEPGLVTQEQLDQLGVRLSGIAESAEQQAAAIEQNTASIRTIVPDEPPASA